MDMQHIEHHIEKIDLRLDKLGEKHDIIFERVIGVERIISNGLQERTKRIEAAVDAMSVLVSKLTDTIMAVDRRIDGCVEREHYEADKKDFAKDGSTRSNMKAERFWRMATSLVAVVVGALIGRFL